MNGIKNQVINKRENSVSGILKKTVYDSVIAINSGIFVNKKNYDQFIKEYEVLDFIGKGIIDNLNKGTYGLVKKVRHRESNQIRAMKIIDKDILGEDEEKLMLKEIEILKKLVI